VTDSVDTTSQTPERPARAPLLRRLWTGELPLGQAFWWYAIFWGTAVNLATTLFALALLAADFSALLAITGGALAIPYNLLTLVAVWRSAGAYEGPRLLADLARIASLIWALAVSAI
jgi:hypothetical protein